MTEGAEPEPTRRARTIQRLEVAATVLLALATVATAWSGYEATRWGQEVTKSTAAVNAARAAATRADALANTQTQIDVATFSSWVDAYATNETELADFYFARFRQEFKPAVEAWIATMPRQNPDAPLTPFAMPEYVLEAREEAAAQDEVVAEKAAEVRTNIQRQSNYVLAVVLFAMALFFAGASTRITSPNIRRIVVGMGCLVFIGTLIWVATLPVSVSV
jgi:hypothetical protein